MLNTESVERYKLILFAGAFLLTAALLGVVTAQRGFLLVLLMTVTLGGILVVTGRVSVWMSFLLLVAAGVSLGRLYVEFGPSPLNTRRLQQLGLLSFVALAMLPQIARRRDILPPPSVAWGLIAYIVGTFASIAMTMDNIHDRSAFAGQLYAIVFGLITFVAAYHLCRTESDAKQIFTVFLVVAIVQSLLGWFQFFFPDEFDNLVMPFDWLQYYSTESKYIRRGRAFSIWYHAPAFGGVMAAMVPMNMFWLLTAKGSWHKVLAAFSLAATLSGVLLSGSVTPTLATGIILGLYLVLSSGKGRVTMMIWGLIALALVLLVAPLGTNPSGLSVESRTVFQRIVNPTYADMGSVYGRLELYQESTRLWLRNPLWGVGLGQLPFRHGLLIAWTAHSAYFQMLAERGLIGMLGFLAIISVLFWRNVQAWQNASSRKEAMLMLSLSLVGVTVLLCSVTDYLWNCWNIQLLFWLSQGAVVRLTYQGDGE